MEIGVGEYGFGMMEELGVHFHDVTLLTIPGDGEQRDVSLF